MIYGLVLVKTAPGTESRVKEKIEEIPEVEEVQILLGTDDISVKIGCESQEDLQRIVLEEIRVIGGVERTRTMPNVKYGKI